MRKSTLILHLVGQFCFGLGLGTGWAHRATQYPAIAGSVLAIAGALATLAAIVGSVRGRAANAEDTAAR
jgi:hypothetical protein